MKFKFTKTSEWSLPFQNEVEINTLEELIKWCKDTGEEVIINAKEKTLEIYDAMRE